MKAHLVHGTGPEYMKCNAESRPCPYGAEDHMDFASATALTQYNIMAETDGWDQLSEKDAESVRSGRGMTDAWRFRAAAETAYARSESRSRDLRYWSDGDAGVMMGALAKRVDERITRCAAASLGIDDDGMPIEIVREDIADAATGIGIPGDVPGLDRLMGVGIVRDEEETVSHGAAILAKADPEAARAAARGVATRLGLYLGEDVAGPTRKALAKFDYHLTTYASLEMQKTLRTANTDMSELMENVYPGCTASNPAKWDEWANDETAFNEEVERMTIQEDDEDAADLLEACRRYQLAATTGEYDPAEEADSILYDHDSYEPGFDAATHLYRIVAIAPIAEYGLGGIRSDPDLYHSSDAGRPELLADENGDNPYQNLAEYGAAAIDPETGDIIKDTQTCAARNITWRINKPDEYNERETKNPTQKTPLEIITKHARNGNGDGLEGTALATLLSGHE